MAVVRGQLTLEEFLRRPERKPALEFEDGEVTQKASPGGQHSLLQTKVSELVNRALEPGKIALAFVELRTTFAGRSYVPDVSVFRWDRIPLTDDGIVSDEFFSPPDLAIEIVSPKQSLSKLIRRCLWFVDHGVPLALLLDPDDESIRLFSPGQSPTLLQGSDAIDLGDLLPALR